MDESLRLRSKPRTIGTVIEKVAMWRKLYNGIFIKNEETGEEELVEMSLEDAAKKVGIVVGTLGDYMNKLRIGKELGFDFKGNKQETMGVLRSFIYEQEYLRDQKLKAKKELKQQKANTSIIDEDKQSVQDSEEEEILLTPSKRKKRQRLAIDE